MMVKEQFFKNRTYCYITYIVKTPGHNLFELNNEILAGMIAQEFDAQIKTIETRYIIYYMDNN